MPSKTTKITEATRQAALRRPLKPTVIKDAEIAGLQLIVTTRRGFWCQFLQPRGRDQDGKRWRMVRHELGDALQMPVQDARTASLEAKAAIRQGRDPHRERLASTASAVALRSIVPATIDEAIALYAASTNHQEVRYVRKAVRLMGAGALDDVSTAAVRLMLGAIAGSASERRHVFGALSRFLDWCVRHEIVEANPCAAVDRPKPGKSRDHTPSVATLRRAWAAVDEAPDHVRALIRFLLLTPLRREEAQGLLWSEVSLDEKRIVIRAERMKGRQPHSLPLSPVAIAILEARPRTHERVFAAPSGAESINWGRAVRRIRIALGEEKLDRAHRISLHDVRRSFVSALAEKGFDLDLLDQLLSHVRAGVFGVYQRSSRWREKEAAMSAWAELVAPSGARDNVVPLRAR
jgi:integrase